MAAHNKVASYSNHLWRLLILYFHCHFGVSQKSGNPVMTHPADHLRHLLFVSVQIPFRAPFKISFIKDTCYTWPGGYSHWRHYAYARTARVPFWSITLQAIKMMISSLALDLMWVMSGRTPCIAGILKMSQSEEEKQLSLGKPCIRVSVTKLGIIRL